MGGKKKGGSSHTPVEAKETGRSIQHLSILEVISEGEIGGLVNDMNSVYFDKTPVQNTDGTFNFNNISIYGVNGTQDQPVIGEFNYTEREISVGVDTLYNKAITRTVTDRNVTRLRLTVGVKSLFKTKNNGDTNGSSVSMNVVVEKQDGTQRKEYPITITGKYSSQYREMFYIEDLPEVPFRIRITRTTADSNSQKLQNSTFWASYTEIIDEQFAYPNTAVVGVKIDSDYFAQVPQRNYEIYGVKIQVPSNYDPITRKYTGTIWDGKFKKAWTNNPAWVFYDLATNERYGLGKRLKDFGVDKWQLYAIGKYCDELVPDGYGGTEPRMTCNAWLTDQKQAYDTLNDIASIFRALPVWNGQQLGAVQDRVSDPVWTYTNANVVDGEFTRSSSALKARHNAIQVEYVDKDDFYDKKIELVTDDEHIRKYGQNLKKVTAFGCTSRGQAYRTGKWILETEKLETETITFTVGAEGIMHLPYDIIQVADNEFAGTNLGGRVLAHNGNKLTLDVEIDSIDDGTYISYINKSGSHTNVKVANLDKATNTVTLARTVNDVPELTVWAITKKTITTGLYRVISSKENDDRTYTITALQHVPEKEDIVTNGTYFSPKPQTVYTSVEGMDISYTGTQLFIHGSVTTGGEGLKSATKYDIKITREGVLVSYNKDLQSPDIKTDDLPNGNYLATIYAKNDKNQILSQYSKEFVIDRPPLVTNITAEGGLGTVLLSWDFVNDTTNTEIWYSETDDLNTAKLAISMVGSMYAHEVGSEKTVYYWLRHVRGVNIGSFNAERGIKAETGADIEKAMEQLRKDLEDNDKLLEESRKLVDQAKSELSETDKQIKATVQTIQGEIGNVKTSLSNVNTNITKITGNVSSLLTKVNKETQDRITALNAETQARTQAITAESKKLTDKITAEAQARGTAITNVTKITTNLTQSINTLTATTGNLTTAIANEQKARIDGDKAINTNVTALTSRVGTAETAITNVQNTVTSANNAITNLNTTLRSQINNVNSTLNTFKTTQASVNSATTQSLNTLNSKVGNLESGITEARNTATNATKVVSEVSTTLTARLDNISVGGRNYATDGEFKLGQWHYVTHSPADRVHSVDNGTVRIDGKANGWKLWQLHAKMGSQANNNNRSEGLPKMPTNESYTISLEAKCISGSNVMWVHLREMRTNGLSALNPINKYLTITNEWQRYHFTGTLPDTDNVDYRRLLIGYSNIGVIEVRKIKLERGTVVTDFTLAPEDVDTRATDELRAEFNSYKNAQVTKEQATTNSINGLTTRIGTAEGKINTTQTSVSNLQSSVSTLNTTLTSKINGLQSTVNTQATTITTLQGNVNSKYTIKAQAVGNGKTAIAGLMLGATEKASDVTVIADKFNIAVGSGTPTPIFQVTSGKAYLKGDFVATGSITADKVATNAITAVKIQANAITAEKLATNSVTAVKIATNAITAEKINAGAVTAVKIATGAVTADKIVANSIDTSKIKAKGINADRLNVATLSTITANMGTLTAGSITGGTIKIGNASKGNTGSFASGATGFYLDNSEFTLRSFDTTGGIVLSSLSKNLTVWEGSNLRVKLGKL